MSLNLPRIAELLALDRERTQGRWEFFSCNGINAVRTLDKADLVGWMGFDGKPNPRANAAFIAAAPELAEQLRLAVEQIAELEAQLCAFKTVDINPENRFAMYCTRCGAHWSASKSSSPCPNMLCPSNIESKP